MVFKNLAKKPFWLFQQFTSKQTIPYTQQRVYSLLA
jgi:hypothetical protein